MAKYISPVTDANWTDCWKYVERKYGQAKRSFLIGKLVGILGELAFLICMLFITIGGIYTANIPVINEFLDSIPHLIPLWEKFCGFLFKPGMAGYVKVILVFLSAYAVPLALCIALTVLVYILYHPIAKKPGEDIKQNASTMAERAQKAKRFCNRAKNNIATACDILYLVLIAALFTVIILANLGKTDVVKTVSEIFPIDNVMVVTFVVFAVFCCYSVFDNIFCQITKWLFFCKIPHSLLADTARFRLYAGESNEGVSEEELAAKYLADAKEKRAKALELEKDGEFARAKLQLLEAALAGDPVAMDNYARHCIIARHNEEAIYWLQRCVETGEADEVTVKRLKDMKRGRHVTVTYR